MMRKATSNDRSLDLDTYNEMIDACMKMNALRFDSKFFCVSGGVVTMVIRDTGFPWGDKWMFGLGLYGTKATSNVVIYPGEVQFGEEAAVATSQTSVTVTEDYSKVGVKYTYTTKVASIVNFGSSGPTYDSDFFQRWLYQFRVLGGTVSLYRINAFALQIPAVYGDSGL